MSYVFQEIESAAKELRDKINSLNEPSQILKDKRLKELYSLIPKQENENKARFGSEVNMLKDELQDLVDEKDSNAEMAMREDIDVTAPFDDNASSESIALGSAEKGTIHPLSTELDKIIGIFESMGFDAIESRQVDDDFNMFGALNFPDDHPARDDYDTFVTDEGYIAPAHTSTMQNRIVKRGLPLLMEGKNIQTIIPGRCFRNEDVDARHEHTLHQVEGVFVGKGINTGNLIATLKTFLERYYEKELEVKTQPAYFPFVEPGFEFSISCPFCEKKGCSVCSNEGWIELLGCGLIHPNVMREAGVDPTEFTGFAWGLGLDRLVMMKHNIEDIRWFHSGRLDFLEQF